MLWKQEQPQQWNCGRENDARLSFDNESVGKDGDNKRS